MKTQRFLVALTAVNLVLVLLAFTQTRSIAAPGAATVLRGEALELVDQNGKKRARINVEDSGEVVFRLIAPNGEVRVKLGAGNDGSGLLLLNGSTEPGVHALAKTGGSTLQLSDESGTQRAIKP